MRAEGSGRIAVVSGGTRGIGRACVSSLVEDGISVASLSRSGEPVEGALSLRCDVTDESQLSAALGEVRQQLGAIDIIIANAGGTTPAPSLLLSRAHGQREIDLNLSAAFGLTQMAARDMWRQSWGRVVFIGSVAAEMGCAGSATYAAAKAGLEGLARTLAVEWAERNITVNVISPGAIETELAGQYGEWLDAAKQAIPVGRLGRPDEIAACARFLVSDSAEYITGAVVPVDGGLRLGVPRLLAAFSTRPVAGAAARPDVAHRGG